MWIAASAQPLGEAQPLGRRRRTLWLVVVVLLAIVVGSRATWSALRITVCPSSWHPRRARYTTPSLRPYLTWNVFLLVTVSHPTSAPLDMHPLRAPLGIHPRHSPSALTLCMMVLLSCWCWSLCCCCFWWLSLWPWWRLRFFFISVAQRIFRHAL